jgi:hypothetical protein
VGEPVQVPVDAVRVLPTCGVPEMAGSTVFTGAPDVTGPTELLVAFADPPELVAVTETVIESPSWLTISLYVDDVAPEIAVPFAFH